MKLTPEVILNKLTPLLVQLRRYSVFIFILAFLSIYVFLVQRIGYLIQDEPTQAVSESQVKPISRLKIDQNAVQQITDLESQNIEVKSLFDQARQNPFTE